MSRPYLNVVARTRGQAGSVERSAQRPAGSFSPRDNRSPWLRTWWQANRWLVAFLLIAAAAYGGLWAAQTIPIVSKSLSIAVTLHVNRPVSSQQYSATTQIGSASGGTLTGSYWTPNGTELSFVMVFGNSWFESGGSSASFQTTAGISGAAAIVVIDTNAPLTVFINCTQTYESTLIP